jgi:hypothetical protein
MNYSTFIFKQMALSKRNMYHTAVLYTAGMNHHCYSLAFFLKGHFKWKYELPYRSDSLGLDYEK